MDGLSVLSNLDVQMDSSVTLNLSNPLTTLASISGTELVDTISKAPTFARYLHSKVYAL